MTTFSSNLVALLDKIVPVTFAELCGKTVGLFGTGGYAKRIVHESGVTVSSVIDYASHDENHQSALGNRWCLPQQARGDIVLATGNGSYQFNQLLALSHADINQIGMVYVIDEHRALRQLNQSCPQETVILFEHADGVARHAKHLCGVRRYVEQQGKTLVSLCPIMLGYYRQYHTCQNVLIWNGQRPLYEIVDHYMPNIVPTFVEYGFFPQSQYVYFDRQGVNQKCSLMTDSLDWINERHLSALARLKNTFLNDFTHKEPEYILVPLQVPDDANIVNSSRFINGMQEFIDYIDNYYPKDVSVVFKAHPKDPHRHSYNYRNRQVSEQPFMSLLERASLVHGITSSTLYEALLAGVKVISEGNSLINVHQHQVEKLLAAMVDRQVLTDSVDLDDKLNHLCEINKRLSGSSVPVAGDH